MDFVILPIQTKFNEKWRVNSADKSIERQVHVWAMIGPIITVTLLLIILLKASFRQPSFHLQILAAATVVGILLTWQWKERGFVASLGVLILSLSVSFYHSSIPGSEWLWMLGGIASAVLTWIITSLSSVEVHSLLSGLQNESMQHRDDLGIIDDKINELEKLREDEKCALLEKISHFEKSAIESEGELQRYVRLGEAVRKEALQLHAERETLVEQLFVKRNEVDYLHNQLAKSLKEKEEVAANISDRENEKKIFHLETTLILREQEIFDLQVLLEESVKENTEGKRHLDQFAKELIAERAQYLENNQFSEEMQKEQLRQQSIVSEMNEHIETLIREKELLASMLSHLQGKVESFEQMKTSNQQLEASHQQLEVANAELQKRLIQSRERKRTLMQPVPKDQEVWSRLNGLYYQLKQQFEEKSIALDQARQQLFYTQEALMILERDRKEELDYALSDQEVAWHKHLLSMENEMTQQNQASQKEIESLENLIANIMS